MEREESLRINQIERDHRELSRLKKNLMPQLYTANLNAIKDKYCPDTGKWIFANPQFMVWLNSNSNDLKQRFLWINGMPGAGNPLFSLAGSLSKSENWLTCTGKTYLCFSILEYLQNTTQVPGYVVYAFPTYDNTATNTKIAITQSMIYQFCRANPSLIPAVNRASLNLPEAGSRALTHAKGSWKNLYAELSQFI